MNNTLEKARLKWACRRGMLELDLYLMPFFDAKYDELSLEEQQAFEALLSCADTDIYYWLVGTELPESPELIMMCNKIRDFHHAACQ